MDPELGKRHPLRILLAEDNVVNQKLAVRLLEKMGYRADVVGNGLEAIEALERQPYDVVLTDVQMPEMDGLEATRRIVERWPAEERPWIVAMTAEAMAGDRERCLEAGMNDYVTKPIRARRTGRRDHAGAAAGNARAVCSAGPGRLPRAAARPTERSTSQRYAGSASRWVLMTQTSSQNWLRTSSATVRA